MPNRRLRCIVVSAVAVLGGTLAVAPPAVASGPPPMAVYAAPGADAPPGNPCSQPQPCSLPQAQQRVRHLLGTGVGKNRDIVVKLAGGTYYLDTPLAFGPQDSGRDGHTVTWEPASSAPVTISGGRALRPKWQPSAPGSKVMTATVPSGLDFDGLFVNGQRQILARYPNYDPNAARLQGSTSLARLNEESAKWSVPSTALVRAMHCGDWGSVSFTVSGRTGDGLDLHYVGDNNRPQDCGLAKGDGPGRVGPAMAENVKEELDAPGEWFYDRKTGELLYYPPDGTDLSAATVETAEQDQLLTLTGNSATDPVHDIAIRGLHFTQTHRTLFDSTFESIAKGDWSVVRKGAVRLKNAADVSVSGSFFDQLGGNGVFLDGYNRQDTVSDNRFDADGASDVQIVGSPGAVRDYSGNYFENVAVTDTAAGPKTDDYPRDILVRNNVMKDMGRFEKQSSGVNISMSADVTVDGNTISDSPRACLNIEDGTWGGHDIKNNDLFDCVEETGDNGSINVWGRGRFWASSGNNSLAPGTSFDGSTGTALTDAQAEKMMKLDVVTPITIRHNRFWHGGDWAIDLDDGSSNFRLLDNLILKGGIKLRDGYDRTVRNNLLVDGSVYEQVSHSDCGDVIEHNITLGPQAYNNVLNNPATAKYGIDKNLFWNSGYPVYVNPDGSGNEALSADGARINGQSAWVRAGMDTHSLVADPKFTAADPLGSYDFTVAADSPAAGLGYQGFPMTGFGARGAALPPKAVFPYGPGSGGTPGNGLIVQPEMLMGATATNIPSLAVQSSLGLTKPYGLYLPTVPQASYAAQNGLVSGDDITAINGTEVTDDRNTFWFAYNKLAPGAPITLAVRRGQADVTLHLAKTKEAEQLNDTSGVVYTNTGNPPTGWIWRGAAAGGGGSYLDDIWATQNIGDSWSLTFYGTGIDIISETNTDEGDVDLTLDGAAYHTISFVTPERIYQSTVASISGLQPGVHTITGTMKNGSYLIVDAFRTHP
ncbi:PDZ domain-containing protein [Amycolatopsis australiensis]|uniref:PDZ domain-containing protein n=1 Tax=Amycolatopsis australiensis TaxID=546364 RepID=A0A1K1S6J6_9PSEU|nr:PDZ domain-containing protein [Amycolatopsis australiensis]SFW79977.1 PDZ domain-containing protein [Amycolatopsis australiensis]